MKSIKKGRGPSFVSGIACVCAGCFGIIWTVIAANIVGGVFAVAGVLFSIVAFSAAIYEFRNATEKNRHSMIDITENDEEPDPLNEYFGEKKKQDKDEVKTEKSAEENKDGESRFCPYCGSALGKDFEYCDKCGKKLP